MANRIFSLAIGLIYLGLGICGFIPAFRHLPSVRPEYQPPLVSLNYGYLFGNLSMNIVSNLYFAGLGLLGVVSAATLFTSRAFAYLLFFTSLMMLFAGLSPLGANSLMGIMPIFEWTVAIFLLSAIFCFYFAFIEGPPSEFWRQPILPR